MKKIRIISAIMSIIMIIGVFASLNILPVFAANTDKKENVVRNSEYYRENYLTKSYNNAKQRLEKMEVMLENDKYQFYVDEISGEWALVNKLTEQNLFSNPYGVGGSKASDETKMNLLSQVLINYSDSGVPKSYTSYKDCVTLGQIKVKNLKNGIRVEYAIGNEETRKLIPMQISAERLQTKIFDLIPEGREKDTLDSLYITMDLNDPTLTTSGKKEMIANYPIVEQFPIRVFSTDAKENEKLRMETIIKTYCPEYTFEELEYDHSLVGYVAKDKAPAVFKFALEYRLTDNGIDVRLGANGIRFDETVYTLDSMKILPYVGAGSSENTGYVFIPDGSGTILRFEDIATKQVTISGKLYGQDYAFHKINGSTQQTMRLPVYGVAETGKRQEVKEVDGQVVVSEYPVSTGFLAIVTEGDSLSTLYAETGGTLHKYNTAYTAFNPRPSDSYNLADSISVGSNATWTVVSDRKYTGSYRIKYVMLEDELLADAAAEENEGYSYYDASYVGMAKAYRDYLYETEQLTKLGKDDVSEDIPLYIKSFGTIDTTKKFLSFPITVETPLTTFEDLMTMYSELEGQGVKNVNFRLIGFANGGMMSTVPSQVEFQKEVGGDKGYKKFLSYAAEKGIGVYPDFDFNYLYNTSMFDGFSFKDDAVRTIDNRYTQKQKYDSVFQMLMPTGNVVISVSAFSEFYEGFNKDMKKLGGTSVSVGSLGANLNSDFDEDDPYNREDARYETVKLLEDLKNDYESVMTEAGNAYVFPYVDTMVNVALDSSRYVSSSQAIPFMGMVLHGAIEFTGTPLNTTGNIAYEMLKMIENGANPYFMLSYRNTAELKDDPLYADYFSVQYEIWKEDLVSYYKALNEALKDVQTSLIVDHEFVQGERVPTEQELAEDAEALKKAEEEDAVNKVHEEEKKRREEILAAKIEAAKKAEEAAQNAATQNPADPNAPTTPTTPAVPEEPEDTEDDPEANPNTGVEEAEPEDEEEDLIDLKTKYLTQKGTVVKVTYENGKVFILNYNSFDITVNGRLVKALGFMESDVEAEKQFEETTAPETETSEETPETATGEATETTDPAVTTDSAETTDAAATTDATTEPAETTNVPAETEAAETTGVPAETGTPETAAQN